MLQTPLENLPLASTDNDGGEVKVEMKSGKLIVQYIMMLNAQTETN